MKHVKDYFITERRNFKDYNKYNEFVLKKFCHILYSRYSTVTIYEEAKIITASFNICEHITKLFFDKAKSLFGETDYNIYPKNGGECQF